MPPNTPVLRSQLVREARQYLLSQARGRWPFPPDRSELDAAQKLIVQLVDQLAAADEQIDQLTASRGILEFQRDAFHDNLTRARAEVTRLRALAHRVLVMAAPVTRVDAYEPLRTEIYQGAEYVTAPVAGTDPQPSPSHDEPIPCAECARLRPVFEATASYLRAGGAQEVSDVACDLQAAMHTYYTERARLPTPAPNGPRND